MESAEKIAKLNPKIGSLEQTDGKHFVSQIDSLDLEALSIAMSGLTQQQYYFIRVKYLLDETSIKYLKNALDRIFKDIPKKERRQLQCGALHETMIPNVCPSCNGNQYIMQGAHKNECTYCSATGRSNLTNEQRSFISGMKLSQFKQWKHEYKEMTDLLTGWELTAIAHMVDKFRGRK